MPLNATITAKTGAGATVTATPFNGFSGALFLPDRKVLQLLGGGDTNSSPATIFDVSAATTVTLEISGTTYTLTVE